MNINNNQILLILLVVLVICGLVKIWMNSNCNNACNYDGYQNLATKYTTLVGVARENKDLVELDKALDIMNENCTGNVLDACIGFYSSLGGTNKAGPDTWSKPQITSSCLHNYSKASRDKLKDMCAADIGGVNDLSKKSENRHFNTEYFSGTSGADLVTRVNDILGANKYNMPSSSPEKATAVTTSGTKKTTAVTTNGN